MSFKRAGNDTNLLETLRKRRINDLFSEDIPEDEAKLLSNGRFTCIVCPSHPIFDTVSMLGIHRKGKKHQHCEQIHLEKKNELKQLIAARRHEQYVKDGTCSLKVPPVSNVGGISTAAPYDSRAKKRVKPGDRKQKLDLTCHPSAPSAATSDGGSDESSKQSHWRSMCQKQSQGPVRHDKQLKNIFQQADAIQVKLKPYQSSRLDAINSYPTDISPVPKSSGHIHAITPQLNTNLNHISDCEKVPSSIVPQHGKTLKNVNLKKKCLQKSTEQKEPEQISTCSTLSDRYRLLQGSGWKKDWDGKWIKDEDAEFDSDEEPPDIP